MIAKAILRELAEHEWDQTELAKRSGVAQATVSNIVRRRTNNPSIETLWKIAKAFGKDLSMFQVEAAEGEATPDQRIQKAQRFFSAEQIAEENKRMVEKLMDLHESEAKTEPKKSGKGAEE